MLRPLADSYMTASRVDTLFDGNTIEARRSAILHAREGERVARNHAILRAHAAYERRARWLAVRAWLGRGVIRVGGMVERLGCRMTAPLAPCKTC